MLRSPAHCRGRTDGSPSSHCSAASQATCPPRFERPAGYRFEFNSFLARRDRLAVLLVQRFADAPAAELLAPTLPAFAASKTSTWADRKGARDLWDLWVLSELDAIDRRAAHLYPRYGPTNHPPTSRLFTSAPTDAEWQSQLAGQTRITISAERAVVAVRDA